MASVERLSDLAADHLAHVERLFIDARKLRVVQARDDRSLQAQSEAHVKDLSRLLLLTKAAKRSAHTNAVHERSHAQRMALETRWETMIQSLLAQFYAGLDIVSAHHAATRAWEQVYPRDPSDGVVLGDPTTVIRRAIRRLIRKAQNNNPSAASEGDMQIINDWPHGAAEVARKALEGGSGIIERDAAGKPVAVADAVMENGRLVVRNLAVAPGGEHYGQAMMKTLAQTAAKEGAGMLVQPATAAQADYFAAMGLAATPTAPAAAAATGAAATAAAGGAAATGAQPMSMTEQMVLQFAQNALFPPSKAAISEALAKGGNLETYINGGVQRYVDMAIPTAEQAGQVSLDHLGLHKTFEFAHPQNMANDLFSVRGSKVIQGMYGEHLNKLSQIIMEATNPKSPLSIQDVTARIRTEWPALSKYQAERIARTETASVWTTTAMNAYSANGMSEFETVVAHGPSIEVDTNGACEMCVEAGEMVHSIDDPDIPPWHPNCRCEAVPVLEDPETGEPWLPPDEPWGGEQMAVRDGPPAVGKLTPASAPGEPWGGVSNYATFIMPDASERSALESGVDMWPANIGNTSTDGIKASAKEAINSQAPIKAMYAGGGNQLQAVAAYEKGYVVGPGRQIYVHKIETATGNRYAMLRSFAEDAYRDPSVDYLAIDTSPLPASMLKKLKDMGFEPVPSNPEVLRMGRADLPMRFNLDTTPELNQAEVVVPLHTEVPSETAQLPQPEAAPAQPTAVGGLPDVHFSETTDLEAFNAKLQESPYGKYLTLHTQEEVDATGTKLYMSDDGNVMFAITGDGDLQNVVSLPDAAPGSGKVAIREAVNRGAIMLDCYDGFLPDLYATFGFRTVGRMRWVDEYAQEGWDYDKLGRPDVCFMALAKPNTDALLASSDRLFTNWDAAKGWSEALGKGASIEVAQEAQFAVAAAEAVQGPGEFDFNELGSPLAKLQRYRVTLKGSDQVYDHPPTRAEISAYYRDHLALIKQKGKLKGKLFFSGRYDEASGKYYLDVSTSFRVEKTARDFGTANEQAVVRDAKTGQYLYLEPVSTGPAAVEKLPAATLATIREKGLDKWPPDKGPVSREVLGDSKDTMAKYRTGPEGTWATERQPIHEDIIQRHFEGKKTADGTPTIYLTSGGGASGKSKSIFTIEGKDYTLDELKARDDMIVVDPDAIKAMLPEYEKIRDAGETYAAFAVHEESSALAKAITKLSEQKGYNIVLDTTGSGRGFVDKLEHFKEAGYQVKVTMTSIPTREAIIRAVARGDKSGRYVCTDALTHAHSDASRALIVWKDSANVDEWKLYDNENTLKLVAEKKLGQEPVVYDETKYAAIQAKAGEGVPPGLEPPTPPVIPTDHPDLTLLPKSELSTDDAALIYGRSGYGAINGILRGTNPVDKEGVVWTPDRHWPVGEKNPTLGNVIARLDKAMYEEGNVVGPEGLTLYRGIRNVKEVYGGTSKELANTSTDELAYISTSKDISTAAQFSLPPEGVPVPGALLRLHVQPGVRLLDLSTGPDEKLMPEAEMLLGRGNRVVFGEYDSKTGILDATVSPPKEALRLPDEPAPLAPDGFQNATDEEADNAIRVYEAESHLRDLGPGTEFEFKVNGPGKARAYAQDVWDRNADLYAGTVGRSDTIDVRLGDPAEPNQSGLKHMSEGGSVAPYPVISLGANMEDQLTVLHEIAHAMFGPVHQSEVGHSLEFQEKFVTLLRREMPAVYGDTMAFRLGIEVEHVPLPTAFSLGEHPEDWAWAEGEVRQAQDGQVIMSAVEEYPGWVADLSANERSAIESWTEGTTAAGVNVPLLKGESLTAEEEKIAQRLDKVIATAPKLPEPVTVWRGIVLDGAYKGVDNTALEHMLTEHYAPGTILEPLGYQATSFGVDAALDSSMAKDNIGMVFEIKTSSGAYLRDLSKFKDEDELLLSRSEKWRVLRVTKERFQRYGDESQTERYVVQVERIEEKPEVELPPQPYQPNIVPIKDEGFDPTRAEAIRYSIDKWPERSKTVAEKLINEDEAEANKVIELRADDGTLKGLVGVIDFEDKDELMISHFALADPADLDGAKQAIVQAADLARGHFYKLSFYPDDLKKALGTEGEWGEFSTWLKDTGGFRPNEAGNDWAANIDSLVDRLRLDERRDPDWLAPAPAPPMPELPDLSLVVPAPGKVQAYTPATLETEYGLEHSYDPDIQTTLIDAIENWPGVGTMKVWIENPDAMQRLAVVRDEEGKMVALARSRQTGINYGPGQDGRYIQVSVMTPTHDPQVMLRGVLDAAQDAIDKGLPLQISYVSDGTDLGYAASKEFAAMLKARGFTDGPAGEFFVNAEADQIKKLLPEAEGAKTIASVPAKITPPVIGAPQGEIHAANVEYKIEQDWGGGEELSQERLELLQEQVAGWGDKESHAADTLLYNVEHSKAPVVAAWDGDKLMGLALVERTTGALRISQIGMRYKDDAETTMALIRGTAERALKDDLSLHIAPTLAEDLRAQLLDHGFMSESFGAIRATNEGLKEFLGIEGGAAPAVEANIETKAIDFMQDAEALPRLQEDTQTWDDAKKIEQAIKVADNAMSEMEATGATYYGIHPALLEARDAQGILRGVAYAPWTEGKNVRLMNVYLRDPLDEEAAHALVGRAMQEALDRGIEFRVDTKKQTGELWSWLTDVGGMEKGTTDDLVIPEGQTLAQTMEKFGFAPEAPAAAVAEKITATAIDSLDNDALDALREETESWHMSNIVEARVKDVEAGQAVPTDAEKLFPLTKLGELRGPDGELRGVTVLEPTSSETRRVGTVILRYADDATTFKAGLQAMAEAALKEDVHFEAYVDFLDAPAEADVRAWLKERGMETNASTYGSDSTFFIPEGKTITDVFPELAPKAEAVTPMPEGGKITPEFIAKLQVEASTWPDAKEAKELLYRAGTDTDMVLLRTTDSVTGATDQLTAYKKMGLDSEGGVEAIHVYGIQTATGKPAYDLFDTLIGLAQKDNARLEIDASGALSVNDMTKLGFKKMEGKFVMYAQPDALDAIGDAASAASEVVAETEPVVVIDALELDPEEIKAATASWEFSPEINNALEQVDMIGADLIKVSKVVDESGNMLGVSFSYDTSVFGPMRTVKIITRDPEDFSTYLQLLKAEARVATDGEQSLVLEASDKGMAMSFLAKDEMKWVTNIGNPKVVADEFVGGEKVVHEVTWQKFDVPENFNIVAESASVPSIEEGVVGAPTYVPTYSATTEVSPGVEFTDELRNKLEAEVDKAGWGHVGETGSPIQAKSIIRTAQEMSDLPNPSGLIVARDEAGNLLGVASFEHMEGGRTYIQGLEGVNDTVRAKLLDAVGHEAEYAKSTTLEIFLGKTHTLGLEAMAKDLTERGGEYGMQGTYTFEMLDGKLPESFGLTEAADPSAAAAAAGAAEPKLQMLQATGSQWFDFDSLHEEVDAWASSKEAEYVLGEAETQKDVNLAVIRDAQGKLEGLVGWVEVPQAHGQIAIRDMLVMRNSDDVPLTEKLLAVPAKQAFDRGWGVNIITVDDNGLPTIDYHVRDAMIERGAVLDKGGNMEYLTIEPHNVGAVFDLEQAKGIEWPKPLAAGESAAWKVDAAKFAGDESNAAISALDDLGKEISEGHNAWADGGQAHSAKSALAFANSGPEYGVYALRDGDGILKGILTYEKTPSALMLRQAITADAKDLTGQLRLLDKAARNAQMNELEVKAYVGHTGMVGGDQYLTALTDMGFDHAGDFAIASPEDFLPKLAEKLNAPTAPAESVVVAAPTGIGQVVYQSAWTDADMDSQHALKLLDDTAYWGSNEKSVAQQLLHMAAQGNNGIGMIEVREGVSLTGLTTYRASEYEGEKVLQIIAQTSRDGNVPTDITMVRALAKKVQADGYHKLWIDTAYMRPSTEEELEKLGFTKHQYYAGSPVMEMSQDDLAKVFDLTKTSVPDPVPATFGVIPAGLPSEVAPTHVIPTGKLDLTAKVDSGDIVPVNPGGVGKEAGTTALNADLTAGIRDRGEQGLKSDIMKNLTSILQDNPDWNADLVADLYKMNNVGAYSQDKTESIVALLVQNWAHTSSDADWRGVAIQLAAKEELGLDSRVFAATYWRAADADKSDAIVAEAMEKLDANPALRSSLRAFVRAQYEETQAYLKSIDVNEVTIYRGLSVNMDDPTVPWGVGLSTTPDTNNPLASWTIRHSVARRGHFFGGTMLRASVPREMIFSYPRTGFGCANEWEVLVCNTGRNSVWVAQNGEEALTVEKIAKLEAQKAPLVAREEDLSTRYQSLSDLNAGRGPDYGTPERTEWYAIREELYAVQKQRQAIDGWLVSGTQRFSYEKESELKSLIEEKLIENPELAGKDIKPPHYTATQYKKMQALQEESAQIDTYLNDVAAQIEELDIAQAEGQTTAVYDANERKIAKLKEEQAQLVEDQAGVADKLAAIEEQARSGLNATQIKRIGVIDKRIEEIDSKLSTEYPPKALSGSQQESEMQVLNDERAALEQEKADIKAGAGKKKSSDSPQVQTAKKKIGSLKRQITSRVKKMDKTIKEYYGENSVMPGGEATLKAYRSQADRFEFVLDGGVHVTLTGDELEARGVNVEWLRKQAGEATLSASLKIEGVTFTIPKPSWEPGEPVTYERLKALYGTYTPYWFSRLSYTAQKMDALQGELVAHQRHLEEMLKTEKEIAVAKRRYTDMVEKLRRRAGA